MVNHIPASLARQAHNLDNFDAYHTSALSVWDNLVRLCPHVSRTRPRADPPPPLSARGQVNWNETWLHYSRSAPKRTNHLFLQFLIGRALDNARLNLAPKPRCADATRKPGFALENLFGQERR